MKNLYHDAQKRYQFLENKKKEIEEELRILKVVIQMYNKTSNGHSNEKIRKTKDGSTQKIVNYLSKRTTPPTTGEVAAHINKDPKLTGGILHSLEYRGRVRAARKKGQKQNTWYLSK